ncbi:MAG: ABC transporter substrate-binding protein [Pseudomonadota bacterium]
MSADGAEARMTAPHSIKLAAGSGPTFGVDDLACAAATVLGYWEQAGLSVSWTPARGGLAAMGMVLAGEVDAAYGGLGPVLQLRAQGQPTRIVASMARALAQNLVVRRRITRTDQLRGAAWAVDGIGALSHHMARCVIAALGIADDEVDWRVVGPPPERIAQLLSGAVDASLIRVEEALALTSDPANDLTLLLGFAELKDLVPVQPHGVLATTEAFERSNPDTLERLAQGIIVASRRLNDDFEAFRTVYEHYVTVRLPAAEIKAIWRQERAAGGFAVNGEMTEAHWSRQLASFADLNPDLPTVDRAAILSTGFVDAALARLGRVSGPDAAVPA